MDLTPESPLEEFYLGLHAFRITLMLNAVKTLDNDMLRALIEGDEGMVIHLLTVKRQTAELEMREVVKEFNATIGATIGILDVEGSVADSLRGVDGFLDAASQYKAYYEAHAIGIVTLDELMHKVDEIKAARPESEKRRMVVMVTGDHSHVHMHAN